jgi:thioredoxin 1
MSLLKLTMENYDTEVKNSDKPVMIDFYADWCGPCKMLSPIIEELSTELDTAKICKVNVDEQPQLANAFSVSSIPTVVVIKNGKLYQKSVGYQSKDKLIAMLS